MGSHRTTQSVYATGASAARQGTDSRTFTLCWKILCAAESTARGLLFVAKGNGGGDSGCPPRRQGTRQERNTEQEQRAADAGFRGVGTYCVTHPGKHPRPPCTNPHGDSRP